MQPESHHYILYGFRDNYKPPLNSFRDLRKPDGSLDFNVFLQMQNHVFNFGGMGSEEEFTFPEGTAIQVPAAASFDLNSHYFNKSTKPIIGRSEYKLIHRSKGTGEQGAKGFRPWQHLLKFTS